MPDLNSLPPSRSPSSSRMLSSASNGASGSPPSPSTQSPHSLAAAATLNAGARNTERRRSSARIHLASPDPSPLLALEGGASPGFRASSGSFGGPERLGRTADRDRAPSLGEIHQSLESEQEGQVNRLLHMIRQQQAQIQQIQLSQSGSQTTQHAIDDGTPTSERSLSLSQPHSSAPTSMPATQTSAAPRSSIPRSRSPFHPHSSPSRQSSFRSSRNGSPLIQPIGGAGHEAGERRESTDFTLGHSARERDDVAFYAAETQMLSRENAMLRQRIRELERQMRESREQIATSASGVTPSQPTAAESTDDGPL